MITVFFVPGFQEDTKSRDYESILRVIESCGYSPKFVNINWRYTTQKDWVFQLEKEFPNNKSDNYILSGFSFGAVTALLTAIEKSPKELWLFSLSPLFREFDKSWSQTDRKAIGMRRLEEAMGHSLKAVSQKVNCPIKMFLGSEEAKKWPEMQAVADIVNKNTLNCRQILVEGVGHKVEDRRYVQAIKKAIS